MISYLANFQFFFVWMKYRHNNNSDWPYLAGLPDGIPGLLVCTGAHKGDQFCNYALGFVVVAAHILL